MDQSSEDILKGLREPMWKWKEPEPMITVNILINGKAIFARSAVNVSDEYGSGNQKYKVDDGSVIDHVYSDGAIVLAKKLLDTIKELEKEGEA